MAAVTHTPLTLSYFIRDIPTVLATYNRLRWFRGLTENGAFEQITSWVPGPALLRLTGASRYQVVGKTLRLYVGTVLFEHTFTGSGVLDSEAVAEQIYLATNLLAADHEDDEVVLTTTVNGTAATIRVGNGDANPFFGITEGEGFVGLDADSVLISGTHEYLFTDSNSSPDYWYRVQFWHASTTERSPRSVAFPANQAQRVPYEDTIMAFIKVASLTGEPIPGREVVLFNAATPNLAGTPQWGVFRHYEKLTTDKDGYAEVRILRGIVVDISVVGTGFARRLQIPTTGDRVNLLDPSLVTEDEFGIQEPGIDFALRLS